MNDLDKKNNKNECAKHHDQTNFYFSNILKTLN